MTIPSEPLYLHLCPIHTPFGELLAGATQQGICMLEFTDTGRLEFQIPRLEQRLSTTACHGISPFFSALKSQLADYFSGQRKQFSDLPLDLRGTAFQQHAWQTLQQIPYGETRSYQQQAQTMDKPNAIRAVANANRSNPVSILIPCHRVIGKDGSMTGYGGGIWRKRYLLNLEAGKTG